ncbi:Hypothetical predicted protein, partial [Mytilus galloprovincialis]
NHEFNENSETWKLLKPFPGLRSRATQQGQWISIIRIPFRGPIYLIRMLPKTSVSYLAMIKSKNKLDPCCCFTLIVCRSINQRVTSLVRELLLSKIPPPNAKIILVSTSVYLYTPNTYRFHCIMKIDFSIFVIYFFLILFLRGEEAQVMDYQTQQYKLFPLLATSYAFLLAAEGMSQIYAKISSDIERGNLEDMPQLHALACGLKAFCTWVGCEGIEVCRMSCGGHGYSHASGIPKIYANIVGACTYEGENTVMMLQTARYLSKSYFRGQRGESLPELIQYLTIDLNVKSTLGEDCSFESLVAAYSHRAARMVTSACKLQNTNKQKGMPSHDAWNRSTVPFIAATKAHCHLFIVRNFVNILSQRKIDPATHNVLSQLCRLYAVYGIVENMGEFMQDGYFNQDQVSILDRKVLGLLEDIRPNAVALVDAFDYPDHLLQSCLGRYDGQVYEALYEYSKSSPQNNTDIHSSYYNYIRPMMQKRSKSKDISAKL